MRPGIGLLLLVGFALSGLGGCGIIPSDGLSNGDIIASVINVTPYDVNILVSGVVGDAAEVTEHTVASADTVDVAFACLDELAVGDPLDANEPGVIIDTGTEIVELEPFLLLEGEAFFCGEIVEIIVSGDRPENFRIDVFAFTPP